MEKAKVFSYSANREEFTGLAVGFSVMIIAEAIGLDLAIAFIFDGWLKWFLVFLMIATHILLIMWLFAPLKTKHRLTQTDLHLRYGLSFKATVPLSNIASVSAWKKPVSQDEPLMPRYVKERHRLIINFSQNGQVLITLKLPQTLRLRFKRVIIHEILLNVDERGQFLALLNPESHFYHRDAETQRIF